MVLRASRLAVFPLLAALVGGCSSSTTPPSDAGDTDPGDAPDALDADGGDSGPEDADADAPLDGAPDEIATTVPAETQIRHIVVLVQENHTFDNYFGRYCTAAPGSNPACTTGPACCEAAPTTEPKGAPLMALDDISNGNFDPNHLKACEDSEVNGGLMDGFATGGATCADARNVAVADGTMMAPYWQYARQGAIGDRFFQPITGQSSANDMYLVRAGFVFLDNTMAPKYPIAQKCVFGVGKAAEYTEPNIGDLLRAAKVPFAWYSEGLKAATDAMTTGSCMTAHPECPFKLGVYPCTFDPTDVPFLYYPSTRDDGTVRDYDQLAADLAKGQLPSVSFVKPLGFRTEHPGSKTKISDGQAFVKKTIDAIYGSTSGPSTLVILTYDEGGGYFDHVAPPPVSAIDNQPYGTRIPVVAIGPFARTNYVSHVTMELSSIVKFVEWNWLGGKTGQLGTRDTVVNNLGSLIDASRAGAAVPEQ